jgi:hypothetical protein
VGTRRPGKGQNMEINEQMQEQTGTFETIFRKDAEFNYMSFEQTQKSFVREGPTPRARIIAVERRQNIISCCFVDMSQTSCLELVWAETIFNKDAPPNVCGCLLHVLCNKHKSIRS